MKILAALDSIFRRVATEYEPHTWEPDNSVRYANDQEWQRAHLWDSMVESDNLHGPYRGPTILHHPDLQYALDNGWRVVGGNTHLDHQARGETSSGSDYLYKISRDGLIHTVHLGTGPDEAHTYDMEDSPPLTDLTYGDVPKENWRHLVMGEGGTAEGPKMHATLRDLVDDEQFRSSDPTHEGYKDFELRSRNPLYGSQQEDRDWVKKWHHTYRRAWETGTNNPHKHWTDPIPDPYANIDKIPRNQRRVQQAPREDFGDPGSRHPRYGSADAD